jgi:hypothetical protein
MRVFFLALGTALVLSSSVDISCVPVDEQLEESMLPQVPVLHVDVLVSVCFSVLDSQQLELEALCLL